MEGGARALMLKTLAADEYDRIDSNIREKIEAVLNEHIEEFITAKALLESTRGIQQDKLKDAGEKLKVALQERDEYKIKAEALLAQFEESSKRLSAANAQLNKLREDVTRWQKELEETRRERDVAVDERQVTSSTLERREAEIERLSGEVTSLTHQLRTALQAKCEAIAEADEAKAKQMEIDFKEKRYEAEISLLRQQVADLSSDLSKVTEDMSRQRRDSSTQLIMLQTKVAEKEEELRIEKELTGKLQTANRELTDRIEELTKRLKDQFEKEDRVVEGFQQEINAQTKLAELYKERLEECESRAGELSSAVRELQGLLSQASAQYSELEEKLRSSEAEHKEAMDAKQETLAALKEELQHANILLEAVKQESCEAAVSRLSPMAASASKLMKSGLTLTQLYTRYAETTQELLVSRQEAARLKEYTQRIVKEIEEKAPILQKQREDYNYAISTLECLNAKVDSLENEVTKLSRAKEEAQETADFQIRENRRLQGCCADLSRQVCYLLREVEAARGNTIPLHDDKDYLAADAKTSSEVISKHLVTFRDIEELQLTNLKLRAALRELSTEKEEVETERESVTVKSLKGDIRRAESKISELNDREKVLLKEIEIVKSQRDVYHRLYKQHVKSTGTPQQDMSLDETCGVADEASAEGSPAKPSTPLQGKPPTPLKKDDNKGEVKALRDILDEMRKEHSRYREERRENERLMGETINRLRTELAEAVGKKAELSSKADHYQELLKTLQSRVQKLTEENSSMEKRCTAYLTTISKHEMTIQQIRKEAMDALSKVTMAEQKVLSLQQEVQMLRDSERRLLREREAERKIKHGQELLMSNLESLKAKFESVETETRMRLESQLERAHEECSNLRRRLQEEQDRLGRRVELAEEQAKTAKARLEETRTETARLAKELEAAREEVRERETRLEAMSSQLTSAITKSQPILDRENRIKELEGALKEREADVAGLNEQLSAAKRTISDLSEVSQSIEKQLAEVTQQFDEYKKESERIIEEHKKSEAELKAAASQMEMKLKTWSAAEAEQRAEREAELGSLRSRCEGLIKSLEETKARVTEAEASAAAAETSAQEQASRAAEESARASALIQELETARNELSDVRGRLTELEGERERALLSSAGEREGLSERIASLETALEESEAKIAQLSQVNDILHDQIQELGLKVSVLDSSSTSVDGSSGGPVPAGSSEASLTSDSLRESDKLLEVMRLLRKEKMSALATADSLRGEKSRLEAEVEVLRRQLEETKMHLEAERNSSDAPSITAERHSQLLAKVETLNQLTEDNRRLMEERESLSESLRTAQTEVERLEREVVEPAKREAAESSAKAEQFALEAAALRAESQRWQERANQLIERTNKNPDELKRLTLEKENLTKQMGVEREQARQARLKLEEQMSAIVRDKEEARSGFERVMEGLRQELITTKESSTKTGEELAKLRGEFAAQQAALDDLRNKERQIRLIAKRYKQQYTDTLKLIEDERKSREEAGPSISPETEERIKQLTDQVSTHETEIENLKRENENIKVSSNERDERAKQILKNARAKILHLTEDKKKLEEILSKGGEGELSHVISQLKKEKEDEAAEKERLGRELEVMGQRLAILQRQLDKLQQGPKPSTSSGEKGSGDPPTANIKPMAGPSTSGVKQTQGQHAATVTPWRETPFASIRPMAPQARTVVVLPSNQSTSTQPVLVAPQQQVVHTSSSSSCSEALSSSPTSSHTDYMPATSSALHSLHPSTPHIISQHMEAETVGEEGPSGGLSSVQPTQNNVSIALVLPQPLPQTVDDSGGGQQQVASSAGGGGGSGSGGSGGGGPGSSSSTVAGGGGVVAPGSSSTSSSSSQQAASSTTNNNRQTESASRNCEPGSATYSSPSSSASKERQRGGNSVDALLPALSRRERLPQSASVKHLATPRPSVPTPQARNTFVTSTLALDLTPAAGQSGGKRPASSNPPDEQGKHTLPASKRTRLTPAAASTSTAAPSPTDSTDILLRSDVLEVEYQVPTSSQRDQEDDILVISDEDDDMPDDGGIEDGQEFEEEVEEEGRYSLEGYPRDAQEMAGYEESEGPDIDEGSTTDQDNNEVDIDDSSEVPNRCESTGRGAGTGSSVVGASSEGGVGGSSSGGEATSSLSSSSQQTYQRRPSAVQIINRHMILPSYEDGGDDSIVPSTPTLFVPRRSDGFGEAVSSPQVPTAGRFTFATQEPAASPLRPPVLTGVAQAASEGMDDTRMDLSSLEEGTGRSVPSTPSHVSPQEGGGGGDEIGQSSGAVVGGVGSGGGGGPEVAGSAGAASGLLEAVESDQRLNPEDNPDGVSSEGEKASGSRLGGSEEEEGREAEASSPQARRGVPSRRSPRSTRARRVTPIVWEPAAAASIMALSRGQGGGGRGQVRGGQPGGGRGGPFARGRPRRSRPFPGSQPFQPNRF